MITFAQSLAHGIEPAGRMARHAPELDVLMLEEKEHDKAAYHRGSVCFHLAQDVDAGGKKIVYAYCACCC